MTATEDLIYGFERTTPLTLIGEHDKMLDARDSVRRLGRGTQAYVGDDYAGVKYTNNSYMFEVFARFSIDYDTPELLREWRYRQWRGIHFDHVLSSPPNYVLYSPSESSPFEGTDETSYYDAFDDEVDRGALFVFNSDYDFVGAIGRKTGAGEKWRWRPDGSTGVIHYFDDNGDPPWNQGFDGKNIQFHFGLDPSNWEFIVPGMWGIMVEMDSPIASPYYTYVIDHSYNPEVFRINEVDYDDYSGNCQVIVDKLGFSRSHYLGSGPPGGKYLYAIIPTEQWGWARFEGWDVPEVEHVLSGATKKVMYRFSAHDPYVNIAQRYGPT